MTPEVGRCIDKIIDAALEESRLYDQIRTRYAVGKAMFLNHAEAAHKLREAVAEYRLATETVKPRLHFPDCLVARDGR